MQIEHVNQAEPMTITLAVVRQDQVSAFAVVPSEGAELSVLPHPLLLAHHPRPRTGDLVAVQGDTVIYTWPRALALRPAPAGLGLRLPSGTQVVLPVNPATLDPAESFAPGDPVFVSGTEVVARAWPWYEPVPPPPALQAYAEAAVQQQTLA
jgi:hypothetical protein